MYDSDVSQFDRVFAPTAQLHGFAMPNCGYCPLVTTERCWHLTPSPQSKNAPRLQEILLIDLASSAQALVKVRVRIDVLQYVDYLAYLCIEWHLADYREIVSRGAAV